MAATSPLARAWRWRAGRRGRRPQAGRLADRAREELRGKVAALAIAGAEKILKREIDASAHKDLIDQLVSEI